MVDEPIDRNGLIEIEVVYAKPDEQALVKLTVPGGSNVEQALSLSGLLERFPEIHLSELKTGVFGTICKPDQILRQGDRVEIYRSLLHDPKDARRQRALKK